MNATDDPASAPTAQRPRLSILLAMCYLVHRTGAELFTRDIALWLRRRGHSVTVFATAFGDMADELRHESIACITDPALMTRRPDLIVGNTHDETVRAVLHFADVPAVSICHDRSHEHGRPPRLSQIRRFVAVDENCAERLVHESGIAPELVTIIANGVDLQRFPRRSALPGRPARALVFSSYAENDELLDLIRSVCRSIDIELDAVGSRMNNLVREPGTLLAEYDLVFAKGRAATEALAAGCACILLDHSQKSMGFLIRPSNMRNARAWNFGRALLTRPIDADTLRREIGGFSAPDASVITDWVRSECSLDATGAQLETLALELVRQNPRIALPPAQQGSELLRYVREWVEANHPTGEHVLISQLRDELVQLQRAARTHRHHAEQRLAHATDRIQALESSERILQNTIASDAAEIVRLKQANELNRAAHANTVLALRSTVAEQQRAFDERARLDAARAATSADCAAHLEMLVAQLKATLLTKTEVHAELVRAHAAEKTALNARIDALLLSASWRVTWPLRATLNAVRKIVR